MKTKETIEKKDRQLSANDLLPMYAVILHNDDVHSMDEVVAILMEVFGYSQLKSIGLMFQAHFQGQAVVMVTHFERAELYCEKLKDRTLIASIEKINS